ncbi:MAG TPA: MFS transporter [Burkholderiaceae bacterium]|nr:MFS transporter [Burkholderiaceae bacterium]
MTAGGPVTFYGWRIVWAVFLISSTCSGLSVYALSVYLYALLAGGRFSMTEASYASGSFTIAMGVAGLAVGRLLRSRDIRRVMTAGALLMASALAAIPLIDNLWQLYAFYTVLGAGYAFVALIPCTTLITRWFVTGRSTAMSIGATGNSFGAVAITPFVALLIAQAGLDQASRWLGLSMLVGTLPLIGWVLVAYPRDKGLRALGEPAAPPEADAGIAARGLVRVYRSRFFVIGTLAFALGMAAHVGGQTHLFNRVMTATGASSLAGLSIALMAASSVGARFLVVYALRRMSSRSMIVVLLSLQGAALIACGLVESSTVLLAAIVVYGGTLGSFVTMQAVLIAEAFGVTRYAQIYAMTRFFSVFGVLIGPGLMGLLHERTGGYVIPFVAVGLISIAGAIVLTGAGPTPQADTRQPV